MGKKERASKLLPSHHHHHMSQVLNSNSSQISLLRNQLCDNVFGDQLKTLVFKYIEYHMIIVMFKFDGNLGKWV